jgi:phenylacetate-CoA ligase
MLNALFYFSVMIFRPFMSRKHIEKLQWKKTKWMIKYAYENTIFYKERFDELGIKPEDIKEASDMLKIPITTKQDLKLAGEDKFLVRKYDESVLKTSHTSGSSGVPFKSYFDGRAWAIIKFSAKFRARILCGFVFGKIVNAQTMTLENEKLANSKFFICNLFVNRKYLSVFRTLDKQVEFHQKFKPKAIYSLPSYLLLLGEYLDKNDIDLKLKMIFSSSELLDNKTKKMLEKYFRCPVYDIYGSTEVKEVSFSDEIGKYHVNDDLYYLEFVKDSRHAKYGEDSEIVITTLENRAMPLLRYSIMDRGTSIKRTKKTKYSFSLMKPSMGRNIDYFITKSGRRISPYVLTIEVEFVPGVLQFQMIQKTIDKAVLNLRITGDFKESSKNKITKRLSKLLNNEVRFEVKVMDTLPLEKNGKFKIVKNEVKI